MSAPQPLRGRRVVDLSQFIAGAACGQILADFGAEVIKVEPPAGDPARRLGRTPYGSTYFRQYNTGKRSVVLDLTTDAGCRALQELLTGADALVVNFSPGTLVKLGLDWPTVHARFPGVVMVQVSAYGADDPRTGFDSIAQAVSGFAHLNADESGAPRISAGYPTDVFSGLYAGLSAAMTLLEPNRRGGVLIDVPMLEVAMAALSGPAALAAAETAQASPGSGNRDVATAPSTVFPCRDGHVYLYAGLDKHWARLRPVVGGEDSGLAARLAAPEQFEQVVAGWTCDRTVAEVCGTAAELGIPAGPVNDPVHALQELQAARERAVLSVSADGAAVPQYPVTFSGARVQRAAAPLHPAIPSTEEP